jgi:hypothetical protein
MKEFKFDISPSMLRKFFPEYRMKTKQHILDVLLETMRYMISYDDLGAFEQRGKIVLIVDKMSRLFFISDNKSYSISFPFFAQKINESYQFSHENIEIDSYLISNLISVISRDLFMGTCSLDLADAVLDYESEFQDFWVVFRELLLYEDGYMRYDYDEDGYAKAKESGHEHRHPLHHIDMFYTNKATFKIGLDSSISIDDFVSIVNINTDCKYMKDWK